MARTLPTRRTARRDAYAAFRFWRTWFVLTSVAILCLLSISKFQDAGSDLLLETVDATNSEEAHVSISENGSESRHLSLSETRGKNQHAFSAADEEFLQEEPEGKPSIKGSEEKAADEAFSSKNKDGSEEEVYFLNATQLSHHDGFSATWLQTREDFLSMPFDGVHTCEETAFRSYDGPRLPKMRMTLDWMQFSVEHMSKWWKILEWDQSEIVYDKLMKQMENYLAGGRQLPREERVFQNTIAVIAFQSYRSGVKPEQAHNLTAISLAGTVESLRRVGFGRVVVAVLVPGDIPMVTDALQYISKHFDDKPRSGEEIKMIGHMEVAYAYSNGIHAKTKFMMKNMPRATVMTLRDAILHSLTPTENRTEDMNGNITAWLGDTQDPSYWKYVYLTEPDSLLTTRPSALPAIKAEIDQGNVMLPHRWQPIPHESDVKGMDNPKSLFLLEEEFPEVLELDPNGKHDACCDEDLGQNFKPGLPPYHKLCGKRLFWYNCGFYPRNRAAPNKHDRLKSYKLMRLVDGSQIVTIAGSEHARRCVPKKGTVCRPTDVYVNNEKKYFNGYDWEKNKSATLV